jgi:hypothetical protein
MVSFADVPVTDPRAQRMLAAYVAERAANFPRTAGAYQPRLADPEQFAPPRGMFLLVDDEGEAGCGGVRELAIEPANPSVVRYEIKHLWISPNAGAVGSAVPSSPSWSTALAASGRQRSCSTPTPAWRRAGGLYRAQGYEDIQPYNDNPNATDWFRKPLPR